MESIVFVSNFWKVFAIFSGTCEDRNLVSNFTSGYTDFLNKFAQSQFQGFSSGPNQVGWFFWNFKTEREPQWNFMLLSEMGNLVLQPKHTIV